MLVVVAGDPCINYQTLHSPDGRSPSALLEKEAICDRRIHEGWYKLGHKGLHDACVKPGHCGTVYPIWMNGTNNNNK